MDNPLLLPIIILVLIVILFIVASINSKKVPEKKKEKLFEKLDELKEQTESNDYIVRRDAVIRLDNLLSKALQVRYRNDISCGENLKMAKSLFIKRNYQEIWDVHKLRNDIVHRDVEVSEQQAKEAYKVYKMSINKILR